MEQLELKNISAGYGKKQVLFDVSFSVKKGEIVLLAGSNGSGKTTLLKTIYGFIKPYHLKGTHPAEVWFEGMNIIGCTPSTLINKGIGYVPQKDNYFENLDIKSNLEISGVTINNRVTFNKRLAEDYEIFPSLSKNLNRISMKMSGGERQMMILGMALLHKPKLMLLDEPSLNLSPSNAKIIFQRIKELNNDLGITILLVEHKIKESLEIVDRVVAMKYGKIFGEYNNNERFNSNELKEIFI